MFTLLLEVAYFWNKMNIAVSVSNSIGAAPMTSLYPVRGAINSKYNISMGMLGI